jgi:DICT domain-containing protein
VTVPLTIGEVADQTGVAIATLRVWETRHGFPVPQRLASGHRRYDAADVAAILSVVRLRDAGVRLDAAIARAVREGTSRPEPTSVFAELRRRHGDLPVHRLGKSTLVALSRALEDELLARAQPSVLFGAFQRRKFYRSSQARWAELGRTARAAYVLADFEETGAAAAVVTVRLGPEAPMLREWAVVSDGPGLALALAAWELPGQDGVAEERRSFEATWTLDPLAVRDCARVCAGIADRAQAPGAAALLEELEADPATPEIDPAAATALFNRVVAYVDRSNLD